MMDAIRHFFEWATGSLGAATKAMGLLLFLVGLILFARQAWRSFRLAKRMFAGAKYGLVRAAWWVARCVRGDQP